VHQSSQASASHLIAGVIKGLQGRRPAIFNIYTPCPVEHGTADDSAARASKLALESRAFPFLTYDPDEGDSFAERLSLEGNPVPDALWPTYSLDYVDDEGNASTMELPLTTADWAATEGRFRKNFKEAPKEEWDDDQVLFHEYVAMNPGEREGLRPFIWTLAENKQLRRLSVSNEMVLLAEDRLLFWNQLREMAGLRVSDAVKDSVSDELEAEFEEKTVAIRAEYEAKIAELQATYPQMIARRLADGLLRAGNGQATVADLLAKADATPGLQPLSPVAMPDFGDGVAPGTPPQATPTNGGVAVAAPAPAAPAVAEEEEEEDDDDVLAMDPYIDSELCTTCDDCTNINSRMFNYNDDKQAYIADASAGTFAQLVQAAEKCPAEIIHPGTPLNPKEKQLEKWIKRAEPFN
jgi:pyruvate-ferredoxin/flavodoxin oxidoreductase